MMDRSWRDGWTRAGGFDGQGLEGLSVGMQKWEGVWGARVAGWEPSDCTGVTACKGKV